MPLTLPSTILRVSAALPPSPAPLGAASPAGGGNLPSPPLPSRQWLESPRLPPVLALSGTSAGRAPPRTAVVGSISLSRSERRGAAPPVTDWGTGHATAL